jgi:hypothetical protein
MRRPREKCAGQASETDSVEEEMYFAVMAECDVGRRLLTKNNVLLSPLTRVAAFGRAAPAAEKGLKKYSSHKFKRIVDAFLLVSFLKTFKGIGPSQRSSNICHSGY